MWQSRLFWQMFGVCSGLAVLAVGLVGVVGLPLPWAMAALISVSAGAAFWLARGLRQPLRELTDAADRIRSGSSGHKVYNEGNTEIGRLTRSFNAMSEQLAAQLVQLEEDRQQLRTVLSSMVEGVIAIDAEQQVLFANDRAGQLLDFSPRQAVGRHLWELVRHRELHELVRAGLAGDADQTSHLTWTGVNTRNLTIHVARLPGIPPSGAVLVLHDTTELRRLERLRQEFVANVSHELKTPLAVIKACVETLLDGAMDDPTHRGPFLERIAEQADRLHYLILDLLMLARVETETEAFLFQEVPLAKAVEECLERHRTRAAGKEQTLLAVPPPEPVVAWADEEAVSQILDNLVDNALKYTPAGGVIQVRWGSAGAQVFLQVDDNGIGIPAKDLTRIFERFYRVDKARSRELGGTGLGLSIVKHLAQALHGSVQATSQVGQGSSFTVRLPAPRPELFVDSSRNPHKRTIQ